MRYLGIDYGSRRVGLALSDENGTMGFPHAILENTPGLADELLSLVTREKIGAIVIGESLTLAGTPNPITRAAHELGDMLAARTGLPVAYESEVFTSAQARRAPEEAPKTRSPKRHETVDDSAAALILTQYLSRHG